MLSLNINAIHILKQNQDKIYWANVWRNEGIFEYDANEHDRQKEFLFNKLLLKKFPL
jgi:hypothetical protein